MRAGVCMLSVGIVICAPPALALTQYQHVPIPTHIRPVVLASHWHSIDLGVLQLIQLLLLLVAFFACRIRVDCMH